MPMMISTTRMKFFHLIHHFTTTLAIPSWPTPSGLTKDNVTSICGKRIKYSKAGDRCGTLANVDLDAIMDQCVSDIKVRKR
jgi:hypothetical protein